MPVIFGKRVALGPILPLDMPEFFRWLDDAELARLNEPYYPKNWHRQEAFWTNADGDKSRIFFAIRAQGDALAIGYVQITNIDAVHRSADLGICIGDATQRRQGRGREALELAIAYCWNTLNLSRVALSVFATNQPAIALYTALGFAPEGVLRRAKYINGQWVDVVLMALLRAISQQ